jgi:hypothetical protein
MSLSKLAEKALVAGIDWALGKVFGPPSRPKRAPTELGSRDVAIQNRASHPPEAHKVPGCCPFRRSGGLHGDDCYDEGREDCTALKRGKKVVPIRRSGRYDD